MSHRPKSVLECWSDGVLECWKKLKPEFRIQ
jgi:hypothetical protein